MIDNDSDDPLLEISDLAAHLGVQVTSVRRYRARGELPEPDARAGRSPLWRASTITAWQERRRGHGWRKGRRDNDPGQDTG